jgi:hypothetical protein
MDEIERLDNQIAAMVYNLKPGDYVAASALQNLVIHRQRLAFCLSRPIDPNSDSE